MFAKVVLLELLTDCVVNAVRYFVVFFLLRVEDALQALELLDSVLAC